MIDGPEAFAAEFDVSRETLERLKIYDDLLLRWNARINLIGPSTVPIRWSRHYADCAQIAQFMPPAAGSLVDLGAGAGLPGLVIAAMRAGRGDGIRVTLVDSDVRKSVFLRTAAREMGLDVVVLAGRIETAPAAPQDVIAGRALAPLAKLLHLAARFTGPETVCLFHKGVSLESELTEARRHWHIRSRRHPSIIDPSSAIVEVQEFNPLHGQ